MSWIFISHAVADGAGHANELVARLEAAGHSCWIAPRNVVPGRTYPAQILSAIRDCRAVAVLLTEAANASADVLQEVQIAHSNRKQLIPVVVGAVAPSDDLAYFFGIRHQMRWTGAHEVAAALAAAVPPLADQPAPPPQVSATDPAVMDPSTAMARAATAEAGVTGTFAITVRSTAVEPGGLLWLNSERDYRDPRCLAIAVSAAATGQLAGKLGEDPATSLQDRNIRVHGSAKKQRIDFLSG
ncbi:MAG: toll/interleukin-1 receptor domain-containing protein, partial [Hyphomicrobiaceae bacterium]